VTSTPQQRTEAVRGVVYVRRAYTNGRIKNTETRLGTRAIPPFQAPQEAVAASGARPVDAETEHQRHPGKQKKRICRDSAKPSDGRLEPSTPSL
jgi:hypothetical protein